MRPGGFGAWIRPGGRQPEGLVGSGACVRAAAPRSRRIPCAPCPAWVTKPPRPLLGDVRVGGSGGRGGGAATTTAAASSAAAVAGGRADVRGGGGPGAERLGACGPLVAAAATTGGWVSGEELVAPHVAPLWSWGGGSRTEGGLAAARAGRHGKGCGWEDTCPGRRPGPKRLRPGSPGFAGWNGASGPCGYRHDLGIGCATQRLPFSQCFKVDMHVPVSSDHEGDLGVLWCLEVGEDVGEFRVM
jgi:hypothetical protein